MKMAGGKEKALLAALAAAVLGAVCVLAVLLARGEETPVFTPPPFDEAAEVGVPAVDAALAWGELKVREDYVVHVCGRLEAGDDGRVAVWFASAEDNAVWVKLRLLDAGGNTLGETGLLRPGEYVQYLTLTQPCAPGETAVTLRVMAYEPETYYSAGAVALEAVLRAG